MKLDSENSKNTGSTDFLVDLDMVFGQLPKIKSPILAKDLVFWLEQRPNEGGRTTLLVRPWGNIEALSQELTPEPINIRTKIHGYGGGAFCLTCEGDKIVLVWIDDCDGCLWSQVWLNCSAFNSQKGIYLKNCAEKECLSKQSNYLLADGIIDLKRNRWLGIMEQNSKDFLVQFSLDKSFQSPEIIYSASDFLGYIALSLDTNRLAWVEWENPSMPWDKSQIICSKIDKNGNIINPITIAGSNNNDLKDQSIFQPIWMKSGQLLFAEDSNGWWNLVLSKPNFSNPKKNTYEVIWKTNREFALPQWLYGMSTISSYDNNIVALGCSNAIWHMYHFQKDGVRREIDLPFENLSDIFYTDNKVVAIASSKYKEAGILQVDMHSEKWDFLDSRLHKVNQENISQAEPYWFKGSESKMIHSWYYPPLPARSGLKPLLVNCHSGPTAMASSGLNMEIQFWTSRGWGFLDINYGGSTGFGREYRDRLRNAWGEIDVYDCSAAALSLIESGKADKELIAIQGSSAGGFTALSCLHKNDIFRVAACQYPVTDLVQMHQTTHRFEAFYLDYLIGQFDLYADEYLRRSPINYISNIKCPVIFFQGLKDKVVLPESTEKMFNLMRENNLISQLYSFENEGHGFSDSFVKRKVLQLKEAFFLKHLFN